jgi:hypothetical protein
MRDELARRGVNTRENGITDITSFIRRFIKLFNVNMKAIDVFNKFINN